MGAIVIASRHPEYAWVPEEFKEEFMKEILEEYVDIALSGSVSLLDINYGCDDLILKIAGFIDSESRDPYRYLKQIQEMKDNSDYAWTDLQYTLMDDFFSKSMYDIELLLRKNHLSFVWSTSGNLNHRRDFITPGTEVW